jgi:hypothetical protein
MNGRKTKPSINRQFQRRRWERCLSLDEPTCYQASAKSVQHTIFSGVAHLDRMHFDIVLRKLISQ